MCLIECLVSIKSQRLNAVPSSMLWFRPQCYNSAAIIKTMNVKIDKIVQIKKCVSLLKSRHRKDLIHIVYMEKENR